MSKTCTTNPTHRRLAFAVVTATILLVGCAPSQDQTRSANELLALNLVDANNQQHSLSKWRGQPIVLNFWAPWCPICRQELPILAAAHKQQQTRVHFAGLTVDSLKAIKKWDAAHPAPYPLLAAKNQHLEQAAKLCNTIAALPLTIIIDTNSTIRRCYTGPFNQKALEDELNQLFQ